MVSAIITVKAKSILNGVLNENERDIERRSCVMI